MNRLAYLAFLLLIVGVGLLTISACANQRPCEPTPKLERTFNKTLIA